MADIPGTRAYAQAQAKAKEALSESEAEVVLLPQRPYPWPVDIFLYPLNKGGLLTLGTILASLMVALDGCIILAILGIILTILSRWT